MSGRIEGFLLARLRRAAARDAVDVAIECGWLTEADAEAPKASELPAWRFGSDEDDALDATPSEARRLKLGPKLQGRSREAICRLLGRHGVELAHGADATITGVPAAGAVPMSTNADPGPGRAEPRIANPMRASGKRDGRSATAAVLSPVPDASLLADVVRAVRAAAPPPKVDEIAVALLLADGLRRSGRSEEEVLEVMASPRPIVSLLCPVPGFESRFTIMLRAGLILPGPIAIATGHDIRAGHVPFPAGTETAQQIVLFAGRRNEKDERARTEYQVGVAASFGYPLVAVAESEDRLPLPLRLAASLELQCGPLSSRLIGRVMEEVLGPLPDNLPLDDLDEDCSLLTLSDLSLAIRSGVSQRRAVEVLARLGEARRKGDGDGEDEGKAGSRSSSSGSFRDRGVKGSGSEIVRPVPQEQIACDPFVPTVERLHGYGEAKTWALDLKHDLELWKESRIDWSALSTKLLLSGPPGTGKTSFARALSNSLQLPLIATSVSTWIEASYLGDVVRRMKLAFEEASEHAPAIMFIDEIDGIGRRTQGKSHDDYWNTIVNRALELLDGAVRSSGIVIVGATNHAEAIDPAVLRSGRLETHIRIPPPDIDALAGILRHHLGSDLGNVLATRPERKRPEAASTRPVGAARSKSAAARSDVEASTHAPAVSADGAGHPGAVQEPRGA